VLERKIKSEIKEESHKQKAFEQMVKLNQEKSAQEYISRLKDIDKKLEDTTNALEVKISLSSGSKMGSNMSTSGLDHLLETKIKNALKRINEQPKEGGEKKKQREEGIKEIEQKLKALKREFDCKLVIKFHSA
jgi:hydroxymethylglutaryl-CoA reductase